MQQVKTRPGKINKLQIDTNPHKLDARPRSRERRSPRTNPFVTARFGRDGLCPVRSHAARGDTRPPVRGVSGEGRASSRPSGDCRMSGVVGRVRGAYSRGERTRQSASLPLRPLRSLWQKTHLNGQAARSTTMRTRQSASLPITPCSPWLRVCTIRGCARREAREPSVLWLFAVGTEIAKLELR